MCNLSSNDSVWSMISFITSGLREAVVNANMFTSVSLCLCCNCVSGKCKLISFITTVFRETKMCMLTLKIG